MRLEREEWGEKIVKGGERERQRRERRQENKTRSLMILNAEMLHKPSPNSLSWDHGLKMLLCILQKWTRSLGQKIWEHYLGMLLTIIWRWKKICQRMHDITRWVCRYNGETGEASDGIVTLRMPLSWRHPVPSLNLTTGSSSLYWPNEWTATSCHLSWGGLVIFGNYFGRQGR